jgi:hypothetical protein
MFNLSLIDIRWQVAVPRVGVIILIMLASSFLWHASVAHALTNPCASSMASTGLRNRVCYPADDASALNNSVAISSRWFRHAFEILLTQK